MKLVLCDDHELILDTLGAALTGLGYDVVSTHAPPEALDAVRATQPDACLLDVNFPDGSGLDVLPLIRQVSPGTKVLIFSADNSSSVVRNAIALGASGYVRKDRGLLHLIESIDLAIGGHLAVEPGALQAALRTVDAADDPLWMLTFLTDREWEVLRCIADGLGTEEIATSLNVRRSTARTHVQNLLTKIGVHSRLQAVALVAAHGTDINWPPHVRRA
ncbi:LuxR C-terminal-related transcriptional regulator [Terrabacter koreensis]|jgi:DNA-binding NarL/FixJ family response regulator